MTSSRPGGDSVRSDRGRVQRAALRVALWVGISSVAIVGAIALVTIVVVVTTSRPGPRPGRGGGGGVGGGRWEDRIIDVGDIVPLIIALGIAGIAALSLIAWYVARQAAIPLAEALRVQRAFVADASHELRTPLTTLTSRIQLAEHRAERGGDVGPVLADLRRDARILDDVLSDLLVAAENAGTRTVDNQAAADVANAATAAAASAEAGQARGVSIDVVVEPGLSVAADPAAVQRAIVALLDNAVRHSPANGTVLVTAARSGREVDIRVTDHGTGLQGVDPARAFDRFVHAEPLPGTSDSNRRGFGLGLALVRDIAVRFGGSVSIEASSPEGTTVLLRLPAARR